MHERARRTRDAVELPYRIGEAAALTGLTPDTLRYYERAGLRLRAFRRALADALVECERSLADAGDATCPVVDRGSPPARTRPPGSLVRMWGRR